MHTRPLRLGLPLLATAMLATASLGISATSSSLAPRNVSPPHISGVPQIGSQITVSSGTWTGGKPITYTYQFLRCSGGSSACKTISSTHRIVLVTADVNSIIEARVTASNSYGRSAATSNILVVVGRAPRNTVAPRISGLASAGRQLTVSTGTWVGAQPIAFTYQFLSCTASSSACKAVVTNSNHLTLTAADVGRVIRAKVIGTNTFGGTTAFSNSVAVKQGQFHRG